MGIAYDILIDYEVYLTLCQKNSHIIFIVSQNVFYQSHF